MAHSTLRVVKDCGWSPETLDLLIPHQANARIVDALAKRLGLPPERVACELARTGNTAAASIPPALAGALATHALAPGARTALTAFGGGFSWASAALIWPQLTAVSSQLQRKDPPVFAEYLTNLLGTMYKVPGTIDPDKSFLHLEVDSLSLAELGAQLSDLGVEVAEEDLGSGTAVAELAAILESRGAGIPA
ncbi:hypothetical protein STAN_6150 [Streptomyces sp. CBMAI 2042]|uniref:3-oxoacyl-[acyl-carrier-protein] synthase III C-terminal domain-containing protein n=1 Tax=Streptomyces sp. CBMAI 2042 TaxID=2305222 RepID=UPI000F18D2E0|nr:hypothetical protein STAN_6150 [Streptomyces sp. CBMAI 2042]